MDEEGTSEPRRMSDDESDEARDLNELELDSPNQSNQLPEAMELKDSAPPKTSNEQAETSKPKEVKRPGKAVAVYHSSMIFAQLF